ncbi:MAG: hypothetical protein B7Y41_03670 [Hydrogenophilales bacterium 28-61-23]|nr:MAG: hypothetical protein B7Y41_03670 [Hydrogenophilales bacterium 28-61-23]
MRNMLAIIVLFFVIGCSSQPVIDKTAKQNHNGILIVAGEGLNSAYDDIRMSATLFTFSHKFAESLDAEIEKSGVPSQYYINRDKAINPITYVGTLLAKTKRDGLAQIAVNHVKTDQDNNLYLSIIFNKLIPQPDGSFKVGEGISERYKLSGSSTPQVLANYFFRKHGQCLLTENKCLP